jgi:hypothetical protein
MNRFLKGALLSLASLLIIAGLVKTLPKEQPTEAQTGNVIYTQSNFDNGNVVPFTLPGSNNDPTCPGGTCSAGINVVNDPTGQLSGKVARINYTRTSLFGAKDDNSGIQSRSMSVGFSQPLYVEWDVVLPYPDISGCAAATLYDSGHCHLNTQRKLLYIQTRGNDSPFVIKIHGGSRISTGTKCVGTDLNCVFNLEANDPTNPNNSKGIAKIDGANLWGKKQHFEVELFTNSSPTTADGRMKITLNGTVLVDRSDMLLLQTTRPYILVWIGQQVSVTYDDMLFDEYRYIDNAIVANYKPGSTYVPPPNVTFSALPTSITSGQSSTLTWSSTNASVCANNFGGTGLSGSKIVTPTQTTSYSITCTGTGGPITKTASVAIAGTVPPPPTITLTANPTSITSGNSSTLSWSSANASSCTNTFSGTGLSGTKVVSPTTSTTYSMTCTGTGGSITKNVAVTVSGTSLPPAPVVTLSASPTSITSGNSSTLTWSSTNATSCTNNFSGSGTSGTKVVTPTQTTTYSLACTGAGGSDTKSATVTVANNNTYLPPLISNVAVQSISSTQVTITWNTDIPSDTRVKYGTGVSYGTLSNHDLTPTTSHTMKINKLKAGTIYHFAVMSKTPQGLSSESGDQTFTTTLKPGKPLNLRAFLSAVYGIIGSLLEKVFGSIIER